MSSRVAVLGLVTWSALLAATPASGQEPELRVSLDEAVELFSQNGLEMRIARARLARESGEARQSRAYFNPVASIIHENLENRGFSYDETIYLLTQRFEWPGRTSARSDAAAGRTEAALAGYRADSLRLVFEARRMFMDAWALEERTVSLARATAVVREAVKASRERLAAGDISDYETRRLALEEVRLEQSLALSELDRLEARRRLATLIVPDGPYVEAIATGPPGTVPPAVVDASLTLALAASPELEAAKSRSAAAGEAARAASMSWIPPLRLSAGYKDQSDGFNGLVIGGSLPIPLFDRRGGESQAAEAGRMQAEAEVTLVRRQVENRLQLARARHESSVRRLKRLGTGVLAEAEALLETASLAYGEGEFTLLELIDAAEAYRKARIALIGLLAEAWVAYYELEWAMGGQSPATTEETLEQDGER